MVRAEPVVKLTGFDERGIHTGSAQWTLNRWECYGRGHEATVKSQHEAMAWLRSETGAVTIHASDGMCRVL